MLQRLALYVGLAGAASAHAASSGGLPPGALQVDEARVIVAAEAAGRGSTLAAFRRTFAREPEAAAARLCSSADALAAEAALAHWLAGIDAGHLDAGTIAGLAVLAACPTRVYRRHEETAGDWWVPAFANSAKARGLLQLHARQQAIRAASAALARDGLRAWQDGWDLGFARAALGGLPADIRVDFAAHKSRAPMATLALALEGSPQLALAALAEAPEEALAGALVPLFAVIPAEGRPAALDAAVARPGLASAALLASAAWPADPALESRWLRWLDDPALGASVAQVLAQRWETARLARALGAATQPQRQLYLALALRLQDSPAARQALQAAAERGALPGHLAAELLR